MQITPSASTYEDRALRYDSRVRARMPIDSHNHNHNQTRRGDAAIRLPRRCHRAVTAGGVEYTIPDLACLPKVATPPLARLLDLYLAQAQVHAYLSSYGIELCQPRQSPAGSSRLIWPSCGHDGSGDLWHAGTGALLPLDCRLIAYLWPLLASWQLRAKSAKPGYTTGPH